MSASAKGRFDSLLPFLGLKIVKSTKDKQLHKVLGTQKGL